MVIFCFPLFVSIYFQNQIMKNKMIIRVQNILVGGIWENNKLLMKKITFYLI